MTARALPLAGLRVLDLSRVRSGPTCVRQLVDWGAEAVMIEPPERVDPHGGMGGPRLGPDFQNLHRSKSSLTLNLKETEGREILLRLVEGADVLVENFRPGVTERLGIGPDVTRAANPRLIHVSISGFGQHGPYAQRPGFDQVAQGLGGLMSITGAPGRGPMRVGIPIADLAAGHFAVQGVLLALLDRQRTGLGRHVTTSLLEAQIALLDFQSARWLVEGEVPRQAGNDHPTAAPMGVFPTADGHINIAVMGEKMWGKFCNALGAPGWIDMEDRADNATRLTHRETLNADISARTRKRRSEDWVEILNRAGVPAGEIYPIDGVFADRQVRYLGMARPFPHPELGDVALVGQAFQLDGAVPDDLRPAPGRGADTARILGDLGMGADEISALSERGVI